MTVSKVKISQILTKIYRYFPKGDKIYRILLSGYKCCRHHQLYRTPDRNAYRDYLAAKAELQAIYKKYRADIQLYQASPIAVRRAENVFDNIFTMRNNSARNFSPSYLEKKSKIRNFIQPINWLTMNNVVNKAYRLKGEISLPLRYSSENSFRLYLADVGLLALQSGIRGTAFISPNRGEMLPQTLFETYIA